MLDAYIYDGLRSPIGRYAGALSGVRADDLAAGVIAEVVKRNGVKPEEISDVVRGWQPKDQFATIIKTADAIANDYNLSPSRYVTPDGQEEVLPLEEALVLLATAEEERVAADHQLEKELSRLGIEGWRRGGQGS